MKHRFLPAVVVLAVASAFAGDPAAWTPPDSDLLFASGRDGDMEIYVLPAGGQDWVNLSRHEARDNWPVWSPDGARIAFQSDRAGNLDLWTMNADGSNPRRLTDDPEPDYLPAWSPDGSTILFTSWRTEGDEPRAPHLYVMNADGSNARRLPLASLGTSSGATWSPDGNHIVYARKTREGVDLFVADADGDNERRLTADRDPDRYNGSPTFSPDGSWIAFYSDSGVTSRLDVVGADGRNRRTLLADGRNWYPRWSPDGRWIVYTAMAPGSEDDIDVFAAPVSGGVAPTRLVGSPKREQEASWRPSAASGGPSEPAQRVTSPPGGSS